jgi:hypothetical protein
MPMFNSPSEMLRDFYDRALLTPELLCLNCAQTAWNRAACRCSERRQEDCLLFAGDMVNQLARRCAARREQEGSTASAGI